MNTDDFFKSKINFVIMQAKLFSGDYPDLLEATAHNMKAIYIY